MRVYFCVWCVKCAKYLAFGTFERADESVSVPNAKKNNSFLLFFSLISLSFLLPSLTFFLLFTPTLSFFFLLFSGFPGPLSLFLSSFFLRPVSLFIFILPLFSHIKPCGRNLRVFFFFFNYKFDSVGFEICWRIPAVAVMGLLWLVVMGLVMRLC